MLHRHARGRQQLPLTYDHARDYAGYSYSKTYKPKKARSLLSRMILYSVAAVAVSWHSNFPVLNAASLTEARLSNSNHVVVSQAPSIISLPIPQLIFCYWLSTPIIKAIRTTRTPDHESEQYFNLADG